MLDFEISCGENMWLDKYCLERKDVFSDYDIAIIVFNIMTLYFKTGGGPQVEVLYQKDVWKDVLE